MIDRQYIVRAVTLTAEFRGCEHYARSPFLVVWSSLVLYGELEGVFRSKARWFAALTMTAGIGAIHHTLRFLVIPAKGLVEKVPS